MVKDRGGGGVPTHGKRQLCAYFQYSNLPAHFYRLISLSFLPFRVCSEKETLIRMCDLSLPGPVGIWCQKDVVSMRRHQVISTLIRRHFMCSLGLFMHNMGKMDGHQLLSE